MHDWFIACAQNIHWKACICTFFNDFKNHKENTNREVIFRVHWKNWISTTFFRQTNFFYWSWKFCKMCLVQRCFSESFPPWQKIGWMENSLIICQTCQLVYLIENSTSKTNFMYTCRSIPWKYQPDAHFRNHWIKPHNMTDLSWT